MPSIDLSIDVDAQPLDTGDQLYGLGFRWERICERTRFVGRTRAGLASHIKRVLENRRRSVFNAGGRWRENKTAEQEAD